MNPLAGQEGDSERSELPLISWGTQGHMQRLMQWHATEAMTQSSSFPWGIIYPLFIYWKRIQSFTS